MPNCRQVCFNQKVKVENVMYMAVNHTSWTALTVPDSHSSGVTATWIASTTTHRSTGRGTARSPQRKSKLPLPARMLGKTHPLPPQESLADKISPHPSTVASQSQAVTGRWAGRPKGWLFTVDSRAAIEGEVKVHVAMPASFSTHMTERHCCLN